jgi:hypothetical protein
MLQLKNKLVGLLGHCLHAEFCFITDLILRALLAHLQLRKRFPYFCCDKPEASLSEKFFHNSSGRRRRDRGTAQGDSVSTLGAAIGAS